MSVAFEVAGTPTADGKFLEVQPDYYLPMELDGKKVLFKQSTTGSGPMSSSQPLPINQESDWQVFRESTKRQKYQIGLKLRRSMEMSDTLEGEPAVEWDSFVRGVRIDDMWLQVGDYFLPFFLNRDRVLWEVKAVSTVPMSVGPTEYALSLQVLAPALMAGEAYVLKASFLEEWQRADELQPLQSVSENQRKMLNHNGRWIYSIRISAAQLTGQKHLFFKMALHRKTGVWNRVANGVASVFNYTRSWEWDGTNNRIFPLDIPTSTHYLVYGKPELRADDVEDILKIGLAADVTQDLDSAKKVFSEVVQGTAHITCEDAFSTPESLLSESKTCLAKALAHVLFVCQNPKPSMDHLLWAAKLELDSKRDLSYFDPGLRRDLIPAFAEWEQSASIAALGWSFAEIAWSVVLEEAYSDRPHAGWIQAAAQVLLRSSTDLSAHEDRLLRCARRAHHGTIDLTRLSFEHALPQNLKLMVKLHVHAAYTAAEVLRAVADVQECFGSRDDLRRACGLVGVERAMSQLVQAMPRDWSSVPKELQFFLDRLGNIVCEWEFRDEVVGLMMRAWERCVDGPTVLPELNGMLEPATMLSSRLMAEALTATTSMVAQMDLQGIVGTCNWLCLAALFHETMDTA